MRTFIPATILIACLAAVSVQAGEFAPPGVQPGDLIGRRFVLEGVDGKAFTAERQPSIEFGQDLAIAGIMCNRFRGKAELVKGVLVSSGVIATRMLCPNNELSQIEAKFFRLLEAGVEVTLDGDALTMAGDVAVLLFRRDTTTDAEDAALADALEGRKFVLKKVADKDFVTDRGPQPFLQFGEDSRISGSACNSFSGPAEIRGGMLVVNHLAATLKMCIDPALNQLEGQFHRMLREGADIVLDGDTLVLSRQDVKLEFEAE